MSKIGLERLMGVTRKFIDSHKTSCFLTGSALYASNLYLGYYKPVECAVRGEHGIGALYYASSYLPAISGLYLIYRSSISSFYIAKRVLGRKRAAKTFKHLSKITGRRKRPI